MTPAETTTKLPLVKILLVDDHPPNLLVLESILTKPGVELVSVTSGEEALERLADEEFAAILLDAHLDGMDGFETAERIRDIPGCTHLPILFQTSRAVEAEELERAYLLGAVDFLVKPIIPIVLQAKVTTFVQLYRRQLLARRESEQLRLLVDSTKDYAIFILDPHGQVATWNPGAARIKQYRAEEVIGRHFSCFYLQEAIDAKWPEYELSVAKVEGRFEDEGWRVRKDGSRFWASVVITALYDKSGKLQGFSKITRDMTERKEAEAKLRSANEDLERRVAMRTEQLAHANQALLDADRRKDEFLATLAHELRNPLAPIRNSLQIMKLPNIDRDTARQTRDVMDRQVQHLIRLVDDLLDISRLTKGKIELQKERIELSTIVGRAVEMVLPTIETQRHQLVIRLREDDLIIDVDPVRMTQVLGNLLSNAAKYTDPHGVIELGAYRDGSGVVIEVKDNGIGIEPSLLPHVFELFVQAEQGTKKTQGGLGIGLTLVKNLVEKHGGSIVALSDGLGKGSRFVLRLPVDEAAKSEPSESLGEDKGKSLRQPLRILVVDDNHDAADSLGMLLRLKGHQVDIAYDGQSAISKAMTSLPAWIFLDIGMPGMDGFEVARQLRKQPELASVRLIALTGWGQQEDRRRTSDAGFDLHLVKPVGAAELRSLFESH